MHALKALLSRCLLAVMLATVLSPTYAWASLEGMAPHAHHAAAEAGHEAHHAADAVAGHEGCGGHEMAAHAVGGHGDVAAGSQLPEQATTDVSDHCCPGHIFGHLFGALNGALLPDLSSAADAALVIASSTFSSRTPEGLERPPRSAA